MVSLFFGDCYRNGSEQDRNPNNKRQVFLFKYATLIRINISFILNMDTGWDGSHSRAGIASISNGMGVIPTGMGWEKGFLRAWDRSGVQIHSCRQLLSRHLHLWDLADALNLYHEINSDTGSSGPELRVPSSKLRLQVV